MKNPAGDFVRLPDEISGLLFRMSFSENFEGFSCYVNGLCDVGVGESGVDEVVVVVCEEHAAADAFGNPFLMEHQ